MNTIVIPKQAVNQLKKTLDNFKLNEAIELCTNEAQTRKFLIEPFFLMLNYESTNLIPEYNADFGDRISQKIDYAILLNKKETILVEAKKYNSKLTDKEAGQLNGYFGNTKNSKIAILTNGIEYRFYSDIVEPNIIDSKPFFIFNLTSFCESELEALIKFDKRYINVQSIVKSAQEVVFNESFENAFFKEIVAPSKELLKILHKNMTFSTKFNEDTQGKMINLINSSFLKCIYDKKVLLESTSNSQGVITTEHEIQAYHTIRTLLIQNKKIPKERIGFKDFKGFFSITVDESSKKVICKLMFNSTPLKLAIDTNEYVLEHIDDLLKYKNELTNRTILLLE
ncbi:type I restriction enzyme HsdR N-terminal domain-containing protein [Flavobacterium sp. SUN046]|uniref:type I restriction enzyme HsdR N-terminal domain-containing protein n=1 Tax=Flavobacterium sp. SUN046 TaxID=3002440 RepID=UPI002DB8CA1B|nr:type I restriction enzyme HsdR N-terminal domain-containing protein [Flavobacterium sp. SUN046]MEC4050743.1 type I restriction enzyme HsdR N-terminal domain-containing protein [Flavobacterium sp. SUN046]